MFLVPHITPRQDVCTIHLQCNDKWCMTSCVTTVGASFPVHAGVGKSVGMGLRSITQGCSGQSVHRQWLRWGLIHTHMHTYVCFCAIRKMFFLKKKHYMGSWKLIRKVFYFSQHTIFGIKIAPTALADKSQFQLSLNIVVYSEDFHSSQTSVWTIL